MSSLTSPPDCSGCLRLSQKIAELESRVSNLYQIKRDEQLLDSLAEEASRIPVNNNTLPGSGPPPAAVLEPPLISSIPENDHWPVLGAKPKRICSTPTPSSSWVTRSEIRCTGIAGETPVHCWPRALSLSSAAAQKIDWSLHRSPQTGSSQSAWTASALSLQDDQLQTHEITSASDLNPDHRRLHHQER
ncbi:hypothetical protein SKAU_G00193780 [Synaphobranchus kaupii]|uniref:Uncharacterized protein n=1 Tax=Synaphobranchus kaupii TaxID=118154 RepID=A0A9Q1FE55_SYNKA|nr:hypothetical protein SKAU_G00193780 [Synaphobranchus kaupii]